MAKKDQTALAWLIGLGTVALAGVGIYFYEKSQPAAPTLAPGSTGSTLQPGGSVTVTNPDGSATTLSPQNIADLAAALNKTTVSAWEAAGIPAAIYAGLSPAAQAALTSLGIKQV